MVWYFHLFKNFSQFVVTHTIKDLSLANEAEMNIFLELLCFLCDPTDVGNLIPDSSAFLNPACISGSFFIHVLLISSGRILSITLIACEVSAIVQ